MDAEQMLDRFADIVETMVLQRMAKTDDAMFEYTESHEEMKLLRERLMPLIRSGLALQRLEKVIRDESSEVNVGFRIGVYGAQVWGETTGDRNSATADTLPGAINAALDAARAE